MILGAMAAFVHAIAYATYLLAARKKLNRPNIANWTISVCLASLNAWYFYKTANDWQIALQSFCGAASCSVVYLYVLFSGHFTWPGRREVMVLLVGLIAIVAWQMFHSAALANFIVVGAYYVGVWPVVRDTQRSAGVEVSKPWFLWTLAYAITLLNILVRQGKWESFLVALLLLIPHAAIGLLALPAVRQLREDTGW